MKNRDRKLILIGLILMISFVFMACAGVTAAWIVGGSVSFGGGFRTGTDDICNVVEIPEIAECTTVEYR